MEPKPLTKIIDADEILSVIECEASFIYRLGPDDFIGLLFRAWNMF